MIKISALFLLSPDEENAQNGLLGTVEKYEMHTNIEGLISQHALITKNKIIIQSKNGRISLKYRRVSSTLLTLTMKCDSENQASKASAKPNI